MNRTNFVQTGGVPIKAERLQELQEAYSIFNELGNLAGNLSILKGCVVTGTTVSSGVVFINGEVIDFQAGTLSPNVIIIEEVSSKEFKDGTVKSLHYKRYVSFGTSENSIPWESFKRVDPITTLMARLNVLEKKTAIFKAGGVVFPWFLPIAQIPDGFAIVSNMAGKTIFGLDTSQTQFSTIGKTGGEKAQTLTNENLPPISFNLPGSNADNGDPGSKAVTANTQDNGGFNIKVKTGSATEFAILPPYKVAVYIEYIG